MSRLLAQVDLRDALFGNHPVDTYADQPVTAFISAILPNIFVFAGLILFAYLVFGGFLIITGGGNPKSTDQGRQAITSAIIGFIVIFAAYWIIQIIGIVTGINYFNPQI
jgi:uncharacterized membrane protein